MKPGSRFRPTDSCELSWWPILTEAVRTSPHRPVHERRHHPGSLRRAISPSRVTRRVSSSFSTPASPSRHRLQRPPGIIAANDLGRAFYATHYSDQDPPNAARFPFLDEDGPGDSGRDGDNLADDVVAILRAQAGLDPTILP